MNQKKFQIFFFQKIFIFPNFHSVPLIIPETLISSLNKEGQGEESNNLRAFIIHEAETPLPLGNL